MVKCIVPGCPITNSTAKHKNIFKEALEQNIKISLHRLPKDRNKRKLWLKNIGLDESINLKKCASICSLHFKEEDINRTLDKIVLRENAVPYANSFVDSTSKEENIENQQNLSSYFSSVDFNSDHQLSNNNLETSFSVNTHCTKKLNTGNDNNQNDNNHQNISMTDEKMLLDEYTGEFILKKEPFQTDQIQQDCTTMYDEKIFIDRCTSPLNLSENSNLKVHRSTSVSPQHFQNDKDDTIKLLRATLEAYKRKSQQTIRQLKRKIKQKKPEPDFNCYRIFKIKIK